MSDLIERLRKPHRQLHRSTGNLVEKSSPSIQHEAAAHIESLEARIATLSAALEPFAKKLMPESWHNDEKVIERGLTVGDFRAAREATR
jgi:hypothetical protein